MSLVRWNRLSSDFPFHDSDGLSGRQIVHQFSHPLRASVTVIDGLMFVLGPERRRVSLMQIPQPCTCRNKRTTVGSRGHLGSFSPLAPFQNQIQHTS